MKPFDFRLTQGNTPRINDILADDTGLAVNLSGASVKFIYQGDTVGNARTAEVTNSGTGAVSYLMTADDTAVPGEYRAQWETRVGGDVISFPTDPLRFEIVPAVPNTPPANVSQVLEFCDPVRAMLGDFKKVRYEDSAIAGTVRTVIRLGKVPGYRLTADRRGIQPAIGDADVKQFALLVYHVVKMILLPTVAGYAYRTRALSERFEEQKIFFFHLQEAIYEMEFGEMFVSYQSFYAWVNSIAGINVWELMTEMKVTAPVATVNLGVGGVTVSP